MPTSEKQIAANQRNAKKSTGPSTPEGKVVASRNAIKHGLRSNTIILKSPHLNEDLSEYEQLVDSLIDELKPQGILQEHLVLKIANSLWRYRRVIAAEAARTNRQLEYASADINRGPYLPDVDDPDGIDDEALEQHNANLIGSKLIPSDSHRETLQRYEMRLDRQLTHAYRLLNHLQLVAASKSPPNLLSGSEKTPNEPI